MKPGNNFIPQNLISEDWDESSSDYDEMEEGEIENDYVGFGSRKGISSKEQVKEFKLDQNLIQAMPKVKSKKLKKRLSQKHQKNPLDPTAALINERPEAGGL